MNELKIFSDSNSITKKYNVMIENINKKMPVINKASNNFHKSHSQFMNVTVDVNDISPIRSMKHCLAVINQTKVALQSGEIKQRKLKLKIEHKKNKLENINGSGEIGTYKKELLKINILKNESDLINLQDLIGGSIRKINYMINQYYNLLKHHNITEMTEEIYEREEKKHHIMTVFKQALLVCRSKGGVIDEGNHIYFFDLGINGLVAQSEVNMYLDFEQKVISEGNVPTHDMQIKWLESCAEKYQDFPIEYLEKRGFKKLDYESLNL